MPHQQLLQPQTRFLQVEQIILLAEMLLQELHQPPTTSGTTAIVDFADLTFSSSSITAEGAMIYNSTPSANDESGGSLTNPACIILDFGSNKTSSNGDFTIQFPTASSSAAIIRIA